MSKLITEKDALLATFPYSLTRDEDKSKLADAIAQMLSDTATELDQAIIYPNVNKLSENLLDILADDFRVEWYDYEGTIEEKRKTISECISIHRYKGTKYAVETALKSVYDTVKVQEWYEYGGDPYHFKVIIYDSSGNEEKRNRILAKVKYYKNLRSHLEETVFMIGLNADMSLHTGIKMCGMYKRIYCEVNNYGME